MSAFKKTAFVIVVILQLLALCGMIGSRLYLIKSGTLILLECEPVDPRSLFSGDYVILNYKISNLKGDKGQWERLNPDRKKIRNNDAVYVAVQKRVGSKFWEAVQVSDDLEYLRKNYPVIMRGRVESSYLMRIRYGVEHYFVPQYEGKKIENTMDKVSVEVAVGKSGESAIIRLFLDGEEVVFK